MTAPPLSDTQNTPRMSPPVYTVLLPRRAVQVLPLNTTSAW
ncbi:hypothetical protein [Streptomyces sp. HD]|nr:hypothetical protein [Streptomyces sp. HD]MDC0765774.1 hypothetical protein [Streptomyces sp. HD]